MEFTYEAYSKLLDLIKENGYKIGDYNDPEWLERCVILRHDVDTDLGKTLRMAELENQKGVTSTYFVLLTSDFYNLMSRESEIILKTLQNMGHRIGLHFDERRYDILKEKWDKDKIIMLIKKEANLLENVIGKEIKSVSMHRPSRQTLESNLQIDRMVNSYGEKFYNEFKYLSDSRMNWRENVEQVICSGKYNKIQLLTHAFWYSDFKKQRKEIVKEFVNAGNVSRYKILNNNITDLDEIMEWREIK